MALCLGARPERLGKSIEDEQFLYGAIRLVERLIRKCCCACVAIGDGDASQALPSDHVRSLFRRDIGII